MKKKLYLIIGHGKCGKSSLVRALTGVYRSVTLEIGLDNQEFTTFWARVLPQSAQEAKLSPKKLIEIIEKHNGHTHVLVTLRFGEYYGQPTAKEYLDTLGEFYDIESIVFMGKETDIQGFQYKNVKPLILNSSYDRPINGNASMVRKFWNWL